MTFINLLYLPSNGTIANVILRDLDLAFQDQILKKFSISETVRIREKCVIRIL